MPAFNASNSSASAIASSKRGNRLNLAAQICGVLSFILMFRLSSWFQSPYELGQTAADALGDVAADAAPFPLSILMAIRTVTDIEGILVWVLAILAIVLVAVGYGRGSGILASLKSAWRSGWGVKLAMVVIVLSILPVGSWLSAFSVEVAHSVKASKASDKVQFEHEYLMGYQGYYDYEPQEGEYVVSAQTNLTYDEPSRTYSLNVLGSITNATGNDWENVKVSIYLEHADDGADDGSDAGGYDEDLYGDLLSEEGYEELVATGDYETLAAIEEEARASRSSSGDLYYTVTATIDSLAAGETAQFETTNALLFFEDDMRAVTGCTVESVECHAIEEVA